MKYVILINGYQDVMCATKDLAMFIAKALKTAHPEQDITIVSVKKSENVHKSGTYIIVNTKLLDQLDYQRTMRFTRPTRSVVMSGISQDISIKKDYVNVVMTITNCSDNW